MIKYVVFGKNLFQYTEFDTMKLLFDEVINDEDVLYVSPKVTFSEKWLNLWLRKKGFRRWAKYFGVPFRKSAYRNYIVHYCKIDKEDLPVFVFFRNESWYFGEKGFLNYLKSKYPNCKLVYKLLNLVVYIDDSIDEIISNYDLVIACDFNDANKYHLPIRDIGYSRINLIDNNSPYVDCFYVGSCKERFELIYNIYKKLVLNDIKCLFYIVGVPKEKQIKEEGIIYNTPLNYDEIVKQVAHSKVVLEIVQADQQNSTLRLLECVAYRKKLITNNQHVGSSEYYCSENIQVIKSAEEIDVSFFELKKQDVIYPNEKNIGSREMLNFIAEQLF